MKKIGKSLPPSNRSKQSIQSSSSSSLSTVSDSIVNPQTYSATVGSITTNPHFCNWCHKQYASKAKLMQHQRKKHPDKIPQSTISVSQKKKNNNKTRSTILFYIDHLGTTTVDDIDKCLCVCV